MAQPLLNDHVAVITGGAQGGLVTRTVPDVAGGRLV